MSYAKKDVVKGEFVNSTPVYGLFVNKFACARGDARREVAMPEGVRAATVNVYFVNGN